MRNKLMLNWWWNLWVPELKGLGCHLVYPFIFWMRRLRMRDVKELSWKVHSEATLSFELPSGHPSHHHFYGGWPAQLPHGGLWTCPYLPGHVPHFKYHYIIPQGGTKLFISPWPVWRHSMEIYLWETFSGGQMLSSKSPDIEEWLIGGSPIIQSPRISDFVPEEWAQLAGSMVLIISSLLQKKFAVLPVLMLDSSYLKCVW